MSYTHHIQCDICKENTENDINIKMLPFKIGKFHNLIFYDTAITSTDLNLDLIHICTNCAKVISENYKEK